MGILSSANLIKVLDLVIQVELVERSHFYLVLGFQCLVMDFFFSLLGRRTLDGELLGNVALWPSDVVLDHFLYFFLLLSELGRISHE